MTPEARARSAHANRDRAIGAYAMQERRLAILRTQGLSLQAIAEHMNEGGENTRGGAAFTAMTVKRVLDRAARQAADTLLPGANHRP